MLIQALQASRQLGCLRKSISNVLNDEALSLAVQSVLALALLWILLLEFLSTSRRSGFGVWGRHAIDSYYVSMKSSLKSLPLTPVLHYSIHLDCGRIGTELSKPRKVILE